MDLTRPFGFSPPHRNLLSALSADMAKGRCIMTNGAGSVSGPDASRLGQLLHYGRDLGATLIELPFVAITLGAGQSTPREAFGASAFLTLTLINFGSALFERLFLLAPWSSAWPIGIVLGLGPSPFRE